MNSKKNFFLCLTILLIANFSTLPAKFDFKAQDMRVMALADWEETSHDLPDISIALQNYHNTQKFTQTISEFKQNPDSYLVERIAALDLLLAQIEAVPKDRDIENLWIQANLKRQYLQSLPNPLDPRCLLSDIFNNEISPKNVAMRNVFWFEQLDPLHRGGSEIKVYIDHWNFTEIPNFFIFLETVEYDPLLNQFAPLLTQFEYFSSPEEREPYRLIFNKGFAYSRGRLFDTGNDDSFLYALGVEGEFYVYSSVKGKLRHSSAFAGNAVIGAGEINAIKGKIQSISTRSGHYKPGLESLLETLAVLEKKIGSLKGVKAHLYERFTQKVKTYAYFNAKDFLNSAGHTLPTAAGNGWNCIHVAVALNAIEIAPKTFKLSNINQSDNQGNTPLHLATELSLIDWVKVLLKNGANPLKQNQDLNTPIHLAAENGHFEILQLLTKSATFDSEKNGKGASPLLLATKSGCIQCVKHLLSLGASLDETDYYGNTIFHYSPRRGNGDLLTYLLNISKKNQVFKKNKADKTAMHFAAKYGDKQTIKILKNIGLGYKEKDHKGNFPIHDAAESGNVETTLYLFKQREAITWRNNKGATVIHAGASHLPFRCLKQMIETNGVDIDILDSSGNTPLMCAISQQGSHSLRNICYFITAGANCHLLNFSGEAPIHLAVQSGDINKAKRLLTYKNDLDLLDKNGNTPLQLALQKKNSTMAIFLNTR